MEYEQENIVRKSVDCHGACTQSEVVADMAQKLTAVVAGIDVMSARAYFLGDSIGKIKESRRKRVHVNIDQRGNKGQWASGRHTGDSCGENSLVGIRC